MDLRKRLNISKAKYIILLWVTVFSLPSSAGFFDGVKDVLDKIPSPMQSNSSTNAALVKVSASDNGLPAHWQAYYLDEPEFKGKVFLAESGPKSAPVVILIHGLGQNGCFTKIGFYKMDKIAVARRVKFGGWLSGIRKTR